jgi:hypothetical protein
MRLLGRMIWVAIALAIAGLAGLAVAGVVGLEVATRVRTDVANAGDLDRWFQLARKAADYWPLVGGLSVLAPLVLVIAGEVMRIRSFLFYLVGGGLALAAGPLLQLGGIEALRTGAVPMLMAQTLAVAGFAAGAVYWLLAGRKA